MFGDIYGDKILWPGNLATCVVNIIVLKILWKVCIRKLGSIWGTLQFVSKDYFKPRPWPKHVQNLRQIYQMCNLKMMRRHHHNPSKHQTLYKNLPFTHHQPAHQGLSLVVYVKKQQLIKVRKCYFVQFIILLFLCLVSHLYILLR